MNLSSLNRKVTKIEQKQQLTNGRIDSTVFGIVSADGELLRCIKRANGGFVETTDTPNMYIAEMLEKVLTSKKRFILVYGGRGSGKSVGIADICIADANDTGGRTYCLREYQSSIRNSVHSLIKEEIERHRLGGFDVMDTYISKNGTSVFEFTGISRNVSSIKSSYGFKRFAVEEAQFMTENSLRQLTPTARNKPKLGLPGQKDEVDTDMEGVSIVFVANLGSSEDPLSKRFIEPFKHLMDENGFYEDDLHLIVRMNYTDNPWFMESGLEGERAFDEKNLPRPLYEHTWEGEYNDSVDNALILSQWFDACIDAHLALGFEGRGARIASHDASDTGPDPKGYAMRHGSVVEHVEENSEGTVNDGGHWAANLAISQKVTHFTWDCDGMGVALAEQMGRDFRGTGVSLDMFKGSESPDNPESLYRPAAAYENINSVKTKDAVKNKRAQNYVELRDRCYRTYRAVVHGEYADPDTLISFSSKIPDRMISKLRSELCRMPIKHHKGGLIELYTKQELKNKFKFPSPNLGDSVMMLMREPPAVAAAPYIPRPIGRR